MSRAEVEEEHRRIEEDLKNVESRFNELKGTYQQPVRTVGGGEGEVDRHADPADLLQEPPLPSRREKRESAETDSVQSGRDLKRREQGLSQLEASLVRDAFREKELILSLRSVLQEEKVRWEGELDELRKALGQKQAERAAKEETLRQDRSRYLSLKELQENFEGYEKGVKSILLRKKEDHEGWKGIVGAVADILEPEPRYEVPLEAVLGQRLQYVIAEGEKEGLEAIDFLKRESMGRGSFIPKGIRGRKDWRIERFIRRRRTPSPDAFRQGEGGI